jgi:hypothetical protein
MMTYGELLGLLIVVGIGLLAWFLNAIWILINNAKKK